MGPSAAQGCSPGKLRMALVGGGPGSSIGPVHVEAARATGLIELVAGVFSSGRHDPEECASHYAIDPARAYGSLESMFAAEGRRSDGAQFVSIVTPNFDHAASAHAAIAAGLPVFCEKPLAASMDEARTLCRSIAAARLPFALAHSYSGYEAIRQARALVRAGELGTIRKVVAVYSQGWLANRVDSRQAQWRLDPKRAGNGGCIADIGTHAFHLCEFVSGLKVQSVSADLGSVVDGRVLDDDAAMFLRFAGGARGALLASQIETGEGNDFSLRCYGTRGGLRWSLTQPDQLCLLRADADPYWIEAKNASPARSEPTMPLGYLQAFEQLYRDFASSLQHGDTAPDLPGIEDGMRGMAFIDAALRSAAANGRWADLEV